MGSDGNISQGYSLSHIGTNEVFSFDPPEGAVIAENWRRRGAATDWRRLSLDGWEFPFGGLTFSDLVVFANGTVLLSTNAALRPVTASLGLVPERGWGSLGGLEGSGGSGGSDGLGGLAEASSDSALQVSRTSQTFQTSITSLTSLFWHFVTPSNTLQLTWRDARLHRSPTNPVSLQVELNPNGNFAYRYDFSRLASDSLLTNVMAGVEGGVGEGKGKKEEGRSEDVQTSSLFPLASYFPSPRDITSLTFRSDDERRCDDAREAFEEALGGLDPLACPAGSTNTVWEHLAYTGTTNGPFAYPQSTERTAVLRVSVAGTGCGELLVGGRAVPLVGQGERPAAMGEPAAPNTEETEKGRRGESTNKSVGRIVEAGASIAPNPVNPVIPVKETPCLRPSSISALSDSNSPASPSLLIPVPRGQTVPLYVRASGSLSVSLSSADFAFGRLPDLAAHRPTGRINFPNVSATVPCFHDYRARQKEVTLPVGEGADALTCTWAASGPVTVESRPPRAALLTGRFDGRTTTPVTYTLVHPDYLFGQRTYSQTARFCPPPPEDADEDGGRYGGVSVDDERESCWHCLWDLCSRDGTCCGNCRHSDADEDRGPDEPSEEEEEPQPGDYEIAVTNWPHLSGVLKIREPLLYTPPIRLEVPDGAAPRCCPCPGHATNWVAVVYQSDRLKIVDANGLDFRRATETVDVRLAGTRPSREVGDAFVSFATNGAVCLDGAYTVLGVGVRRAGVDLAALDALNDDFGLPVPVATNAAEAAELELVTAVGLDGGNVRIGFEGASAPFALWAWDSALGDFRPLASSDGGPLDVSLAAWRRLVGGATDAETSRTTVFVTASAPGAATLAFRYWGVFDGRFVEDVARQRLTAVAPRVRADIDHDGRLGASDDAARLAGRPFRFWFNEDRDKGDFVGQVADATPNAQDLEVNGKLDLVNLFPVEIDVSPFRRAWGRAATFRLRAGAEGLRFCVLGEGFSSGNVLGLASAPVFTADGEPLEAAALTPLDSVGLDLGGLAGRPLLRPIALAFEAARPMDAWSGPEVVVSLGDAEVYRERLPVSITSVDGFYRYADLRGAEACGGFAPTAPGEPGNLPDGETDGRHFVFVHGYNVNAAASRLWARAMFKRLWWAGSRSRFTAVDWRGDYSQFAGFAPNYWANVVHALRTAPALAELANALPGEKVLLAHSLGNVLTSEACKYHSLAYSKYYMLNAAVPVEAYDGNSAIRAPMKPSAWRPYAERILSGNWYAVFGTKDARRGIAWRGRFADLPDIVNFYSPTEDVLSNPEIDGMGGAWSTQELLKGTGLAIILPKVADEGGWGFNRLHTIPLSATELLKTEFTDDELKISPPFLPFADKWLHTTNAVTEAQVSAVLPRILADGIPATTFAAGANEIGGGVRNLNYHSLMTNEAQWPEQNKSGQNIWKHSAIKNLAYPFVHLLFAEFVKGK